MLIEQVIREKGHECATVAPSDTVAAAVAILAARHIGAVVAAGPNGTLLGIFSERDLVGLLARDGHAALDREIGAVMTSPVVTCKAEDTVDHVLAIMTQRRIRHVPVMNANGLAAMVSIRDLVRRRLSEKELEAAVLLDISRFHG